MNTKVSIQVEKTASGYSAYSPEIGDSQVQGDSLDAVINALQEVLNHYLNSEETALSQKNADVASMQQSRPIWEIAQDITQDMTESEIAQLPQDGAEQHNHYIYGTPKRTA
jgi:predicted RNase H-like HicB family nuclease